MKDVPLNIAVSPHGDGRLIKLEGSLTLENIFTFQKKVREGGPADTVVDVSQVEYIDSAGIGCLVNTFVSCQNSKKNFVLVGPNDRVLTVLKVTRVDQLFPISATLPA